MPSAAIPGFTGTVIGPHEAGYDAARAIWNAMHDRRPALIARPQSVPDVVAAVRYARAEGLLIAVRGGGHSMPGHSVCDDGIVIDLRALSRVHVDPQARRATVGGGTLLGEVDRATQEHGLVLPAGVVSHTGAGGLTLGGGVGRLMRRFGLTIDSLRSAEVVSADGEILRASADQHADLFWALRGGGGNFGIVTEFEFALHELSELLILATFHPLAEARRVIELGRREMGDPMARDELLWTSFLRRASDVPWMPPALVGAHGIMSLVEWSGDAADGQAVLARIREELRPAASDLSVVPFLFMQTITDDLFAHGLRTYIKAGFAGDLPDGLIDVLLERAASVRSPISQVELLALGGAIARVDSDATAFPFRHARWLINIPATWRDAADDEGEIAWARATYAAIKPYLSEGNYVNFMGDDEDDTAAGAYGRTIERLRQVKSVYDPDNVFRLNQNIEPAPAAPGAPGRHPGPADRPRPRAPMAPCRLLPPRRSSAACGAPTRGRGRTWPRHTISHCSRRCSAPRALAGVPGCWTWAAVPGSRWSWPPGGVRSPAAWTSAPGCWASPATGFQTPTCARATWSSCRSATPHSTPCSASTRSSSLATRAARCVKQPVSCAPAAASWPVCSQSQSVPRGRWCTRP